MKGYVVVDEDLKLCKVEEDESSDWHGTLWPQSAPEEKATIFSSLKAARHAMRKTNAVGKTRHYRKQTWHVLKFVDDSKADEEE